MSNEHHHHQESDHASHCKPKGDCCSPWLTVVKRGIWVVYPIMGICFLHVFWLLNDRIDSIMYNTVPIHERPAPYVDIKSPVQGSVQLGMDLKLIKEPSPEMLKLGKDTFQDRCINCHGPEGKGDGPAGIALKARNFHTKDGWRNGRELGKMFGTITKGTAFGMQAFDTLPVQTRISLIHYIRKFTGDFPEITDSEVDALDKEYGLSKQTINPHKIPIKLATQLIVEEAAVSKQMQFEVLMKISKDNSKGASILKAYSENMVKTIASINNSSVWKNDLESFVKFVEVNVGSNGLRPETLLMDKQNMEELYNYLKDLK